VKVAAYQAPLLPSGSREAVDLIRTRVEWCEGLCNDSNYPEPARIMASKGATALFVPTNNGLPPEKADVAAQLTEDLIVADLDVSPRKPRAMR
jgi:hypothetical protein